MASLNAEQSSWIDLKAFIELLVMYHLPHVIKVFPEANYQYQWSAINKELYSKKFKLQFHGQYFGIESIRTLSNKLNSVQQLANRHQQDIVLHLGYHVLTGFHAIRVQYSYQKKQFQLFDINSLFDYVNKPKWLSSKAIAEIIYQKIYNDDFDQICKAISLNILTDPHISLSIALVTNGGSSNLAKELTAICLHWQSEFGRLSGVYRKLNLNRALLHAVIVGEAQIIPTLIKLGADVDYNENGDGSCLQIAFSNGDLNCIKVLLENNANVYLASNSGKKPLHCVNSLTTFEHTRQILEKHPFLKLSHYFSSIGLSAFHYAILSGNTNLLEEYKQHCHVDFIAANPAKLSYCVLTFLAWKESDAGSIIIKHLLSSKIIMSETKRRDDDRNKILTLSALVKLEQVLYESSSEFLTNIDKSLAEILTDAKSSAQLIRLGLKNCIIILLTKYTEFSHNEMKCIIEEFRIFLQHMLQKFGQHPSYKKYIVPLCQPLTNVDIFDDSLIRIFMQSSTDTTAIMKQLVLEYGLNLHAEDSELDPVIFCMNNKKLTHPRNIEFGQKFIIDTDKSCDQLKARFLPFFRDDTVEEEADELAQKNEFALFSNRF